MSGEERVLPYDRDVLVEVAIFHYKPGIEGCACGWSELGRCHGQHVADVYEQSVAARTAAAAREESS